MKVLIVLSLLLVVACSEGGSDDILYDIGTPEPVEVCIPQRYEILSIEGRFAVRIFEDYIFPVYYDSLEEAVAWANRHNHGFKAHEDRHEYEWDVVPVCTYDIGRFDSIELMPTK